MVCPYKNPECVKHTPVQHAPSCSKSGPNRCQDILHNKECWTADDLRIMGVILNNYFPPEKVEKTLEDDKKQGKTERRTRVLQKDDTSVVK